MNIKKLVALLAVSSTLAACQTDDTDVPEPEMEDTDEEIDTQEEEAELDDDPAEFVVSDEELEPYDEDQIDAAEPIDDLSQYEEFEGQDAFDPDQFDAYLVLDEGGRREIIFMEDDEQVFKSIYIEEDNNLRIIDLPNSEVILNAPI